MRANEFLDRMGATTKHHFMCTRCRKATYKTAGNMYNFSIHGTFRPVAKYGVSHEKISTRRGYGRNRFCKCCERR
jgi:hypothetical protein